MVEAAILNRFGIKRLKTKKPVENEGTLKKNFNS
jgi:hypothetical protein